MKKVFASITIALLLITTASVFSPKVHACALSDDKVLGLLRETFSKTENIQEKYWVLSGFLSLRYDIGSQILDNGMTAAQYLTQISYLLNESASEGGCGTVDIIGLLSIATRLSSDNQALINDLISTPPESSNPDPIYSTTHFDLHYTLVSDDPTNPDATTMDFVLKVASDFEEAWTVEVQNWGYRAGTTGQSDRYEVFIKYIAPPPGYAITYGQTPPYIAGSYGIGGSYIEINNELSGYDDGLILGTVAHEYYHACQNSYISIYALWPKLFHEWVVEGSAAWMEHEVFRQHYPTNSAPIADLSLFSYRMNEYLSTPYLDFENSHNDRGYPVGLYWYFLADNTQINFAGGNNEKRTIVRRVWEDLSTKLLGWAELYGAIDDALSNAGYSFDSSFKIFAKANWQVNAWYPNDSQYFNSINSKSVTFSQNTLTLTSGSNGVQSVEHRSAFYFSVHTPVSKLAFEGDNSNFFVKLLTTNRGELDVSLSVVWQGLVQKTEGSIEVSDQDFAVIVGRLDDGGALLGSNGAYEVTFTINQGWQFGADDLARTEYHIAATNYKIADQPFQTLWSSPHEGKNLMALTGDVNGDGKVEVVKVSGDNLKVISGTGTGLWTRTISGVDSYYGTGYLYLGMLEDVTGDGIPEIFVSRKTSDTVGRIYVYDGNGNLLKTLTRTVASDGNMWAVAVFDLNKDGNKEIFCGISSNYVGNPRGACLFDYNTGNQLWYYAAGNSIADCVADLNNDGKMEITSTWWTVHNGAGGSGKGSNTYTDDSSVYVVTINENGNEMFTWQIHGTHNHGGALERITDLNKDGTKELLVFHGHEAYYPGYSQIFMLSPTGTILKTYTGSYNANWYQPTIADINNDGKDEIIIGCNDGVLRVFDYNLNVIASSNRNYAPQAVTDLNGDGKLEIVVSDYSTRELVILDNNLNQLWKLSFPVVPTAIVSDVNGDGANELIITADQLYVAANPTTTKEPTPVFDPSVNKISLRYEITPVDTTFKPGTSASVSIYDISKRGQSVLLNLGPRPEDVYIGSFTFDVFKNRDADPKITRDEVVQNFYEAMPQSILQKLSTYISKTHVLYSDLSTVDFLFANFASQILEGTKPQATQAFSVLTFLLPVPLVEPTFVYSQYGYKLAGTWTSLGGGFGTGSLKTVSVYCFANLKVMDSLGRITDKTTNEILGAYYFEADLNNDGQLEDSVILPDTPGLEYTIWVIPEPGAPMDSTYTLVLGSADIGIPLAENVMLSDAPVNGYELTSLTSPQQTPPITTLTIGSPQFTNSSGDSFITSNTPLTLQANPGSADVDSTAYRIYNSTYTFSTTCTAPQIFYLTGLDDGKYYIDYYSVDTAGNIEPTNTRTVNLDNTPPSLTVEIPQQDAALQDGVNYTISAWDLSSVASVTLSIQCPQGNTISPEFQSMPCELKSDGKWHLQFDTTRLPDGFYLLVVNGTDVLGNWGTKTVSFSIRNWAALQMLPSTPNSNAGRTMPIKFSIRVKASVDPTQPFVYNEELTIKIYKIASPSNVLLQTSIFGSGSTNYRIDTGTLYITNFKTLSTPATYLVNIYRKGMLIGTFQFSTTK